MHYTIAHIKDIQGDFEVDFNKNGNKFQVSIRIPSTKANIFNTFDDDQKAKDTFLKLSLAIIEGCYSQDQRINILLEGDR